MYWHIGGSVLRTVDPHGKCDTFSPLPGISLHFLSKPPMEIHMFPFAPDEVTCWQVPWVGQGFNIPFICTVESALWESMKVERGIVQRVLGSSWGELPKNLHYLFIFWEGW